MQETSNFGRYQKAPQQNTHSSDVSTYLTGKSPFPSLDEFIESIASTGNVSGGITYFNLNNKLTKHVPIIWRDNLSPDLQYSVSFLWYSYIDSPSTF